MGERQGWLLEPTFQRAVKVAVGSDRLTSGASRTTARSAKSGDESSGHRMYRAVWPSSRKPGAGADTSTRWLTRSGLDSA